MTRSLIISMILLLLGISAGARELDSLQLGTNVIIHQSQAVSDSLENHILSNRNKPIYGYRIRIFFSNAQNAREASAATAERFAMNYPDYPVYRSYINPNFKVTVGDFYSRSDALRLLSVMRKDFPAAFVVREHIN